MHGSNGSHAPHTPVWSNTPGVLSSRIGIPLARFIHLELAAGVMLALATIVALVWANSPWSESYHALWSTEIELGIGSWHLSHHGHHLTLHALVNDGLMVLFFLVVGLEVKRELVSGHLVDRRAAAVPAIGAIGGMLVPALVFFFMVRGTGFEGGWGIPMATDIAFAIGVLSLLGSRVPSALKIFLLTLAVVDDLGAIAVIAIFYSSGVSFTWLAFAVALVALLVGLKSSGVRYTPTYVVVGVTLWYSLLQSGVHATIAGVICGLLAPATIWVDRSGQTLPITSNAAESRYVHLALRESVPVSERLEQVLHPFSVFFILPIFALANAGVGLSPSALLEASTSAVPLAVAAGLVVGKIFGITLFTVLAVRLGIGSLPRGCSTPAIAGVAALGGIGFTVAMFVTELAFDDHHVVEQAKLGILVASLAAAVLGVLILRSALKEPAEGQGSD